jgi:hypothetical protein
MRKKSIILIVLTLLSIVVISHAEEGLDGWAYYKDILRSDKGGFQSFFLDEEVYGHSKRNLSDIRIINEDNNFIPFYIHNEYLSAEEETQIEYDSVLLSSYRKDNDKYIEFKIIEKDDYHDVLGNEILFSIRKDNFLKEVKVYGSHDNYGWSYVKTDYIYKIDEAEKLNIKLDELYKFTHYRIILINDIEDTEIKDFKLIFRNKNVVYEHYQKTKKVDVKIEYEDDKTVILFENINNLKIKYMRIISEDDYKRKYQIFYKNEDDVDYRWLGGGEIYRRNLKNYNIEETEIPWDKTSESFISADFMRIDIDDRDDKPIDIKDIEICYYVDKIVFEDQTGDTYRLIFGNKEAKEVFYDIAESKKHIEEEEQKTCTLSDVMEREIEISEDKMNYRLILNITVIIISIVLVIIIIRKSSFKDL